MLNTIVTTDRKNHKESVELAAYAAEKLGIKNVKRNRAALPEMREEYGVDNILVAKKGSFVLDTLDGELFFHPNMSQLRIKNIRMGDEDHMTAAMDLKEGMSVLDCTLGFGADAIVASFVTGESGSVTLSFSPISFITFFILLFVLRFSNSKLSDGGSRFFFRVIDGADVLAIRIGAAFAFNSWRLRFRSLFASSDSEILRRLASGRRSKKRVVSVRISF